MATSRFLSRRPLLVCPPIRRYSTAAFREGPPWAQLTADEFLRYSDYNTKITHRKRENGISTCSDVSQGTRNRRFKTGSIKTCWNPCAFGRPFEMNQRRLGTTLCTGTPLKCRCFSAMQHLLPISIASSLYEVRKSAGWSSFGIDVAS